MKGRQRNKQKTGWVTYAAVRADPNGSRAERRAWQKQYDKRAKQYDALAATSSDDDADLEGLREARRAVAARRATSAPEQTSAKPDTPA